jgi:hypothetical protein
VDIVKPPQVRVLPDILTLKEIERKRAGVAPCGAVNITGDA